MENSKVWNKDYCKEVINYFCNEQVMENYSSDNRKYKRNLLFERDKGNNWVWKSVDNLIKSNLGENYFLSTWLIGLRYDKNDFFTEHRDGEGTANRYLSGGIELSDENSYRGGIYVLKGSNSRSKQGELFTHDPYVLHEITKVTKGTRYSLHFCIGKKPDTLI